MKTFLINAGSVFASTILFVLILSFAGVLGPGGAAIAATGLKIIGWIVLYILMVRIPIALIKANEIRSMKKMRKALHDDANLALSAAAKAAKRDVINIKKNSIDNPITPMPADPDLEEIVG